MQSHRLARLLRIIVEVREQPDRHAHQIAKDLGISTRQFYYDRNQLAEMGFGFSRRKGRFTVLNDPVVTIGKLPFSELLALVLATRHLFATKSFPVVRRAIKGLHNIIDHVPEPQKKLLTSIIQDVIIKDGFGCQPHILEDAQRAVDEKRRILVHFRNSASGKPTALDPFALCFWKSKLCLDAYAIDRKKRRRYGMSTIEKIVFTPFFRPEYSREEVKS